MSQTGLFYTDRRRTAHEHTDRTDISISIFALWSAKIVIS